jgi:hypothetical protein
MHTQVLLKIYETEKTWKSLLTKCQIVNIDQRTPNLKKSYFTEMFLAFNKNLGIPGDLIETGIRYKKVSILFG